MKAPNQVSVMLTHEIPITAPLKPVKGFRPWGVGKSYRRCRREYARQMRRWKKGPKSYTHTVYIPAANIEMVTTTPAEPRDDWDTPRKVPTSFQAEFTLTPTPVVRNLFGLV